MNDCLKMAFISSMFSAPKPKSQPITNIGGVPCHPMDPVKDKDMIDLFDQIDRELAKADEWG